MTATEDKAELRRAMRIVRRSIPADERARRSALLADAVAARPAYAQASTVLAFVGVRDEPDTGPLLRRVVADGKRLALPRVAGSAMEAVVSSPDGPFARSSFGIPEPTALDALAAIDVDLVVVPGLAFDRAGFRVGYGGGFYDRFLSGLRADAATIGVCFREQVVPAVPREPFDLPVDVVVSA